MRKNVFSFFAADGREIVCSSWRPAHSPSAIVQIAHGMGEHVDRYSAMAEFLARHDIAVFGNDHRGHGRTALCRGEFGEYGECGVRGLFDDVAQLSRIAKATVPGVPLVLFGQDVGSLAAQEYAILGSDDLAGLALSGSDALDRLIRAIGDGIERTDGDAGRPFETLRTPFNRSPIGAFAGTWSATDALCFDWRDDATVAQIRVLSDRISSPARLARIRPTLPIYLLSAAPHRFSEPLDGMAQIEKHLHTAGLLAVDHARPCDPGRDLSGRAAPDDDLSRLLSWIGRVLLVDASR